MALILVGSLPYPSPLATIQRWSEENGKQTGCRITLIDSQGIVLAYNQGSPEQMDNHLNRPEVRAAFQFGNGHSVRFSHQKERVCCGHRSGTDCPAYGPSAQEVTEGFRIARRDLF